MNYWIFKVSEQGKYADEPGRKYVYDNTHSGQQSASAKASPRIWQLQTHRDPKEGE